MLPAIKDMDSSTKDSLANISSVTGIGLTMAEIQSTISILVLITALLLNDRDWET